MDDNSQNQKDFDILDEVKNILNSNPVLCNFSRYTDRGDFYNDVGMGIIWKNKESGTNPNGNLNFSQIVRFVKKLDSRFLYRICDYCARNFESNSFSNLFNAFNVSKMDYDKYNNMSFYGTMLECLKCKMFSIDYEFSVKGVSLTPLDFVSKNMCSTPCERDFTIKMCNNINKLIFVGDKCHLLAIIDILHNVYVSQTILERIYKDNKEHFNVVVLKLYNVISNYCVYGMTVNLPKYIKNTIVPWLTNDIYKSKILKKLDSGNFGFKDIFNYNFIEDNQKDIDVKSDLEPVIEKYLTKLINRKYDFASIDIAGLINDARRNLTESMKYATSVAFKNGLKLYSIFKSCGWDYYDPTSKNNSIYLNVEKNYIYKDVDIIPDRAYVACPNCQDRVLNESGLKKIAEILYVKRILIEVETGTMYAECRHPNVRSGKVCMGDLRGMISFTDVDEQKIRENLSKCEELLRGCNYTSSYTNDGERIFKDDEYSMPLKDKIEMDNTVNNKEIITEQLEEVQEDEEELTDVVSDIINKDVSNAIVNNIANDMESLEEVTEDNSEESE